MAASATMSTPIYDELLEEMAVEADTGGGARAAALVDPTDPSPPSDL